MARSFTQEHLLSVIADVSQQEEHKRGKKYQQQQTQNHFQTSAVKSPQQEYKWLGIHFTNEGSQGANVLESLT